MKPRWIVQLLLFVSMYSPMSVILAFQDIKPGAWSVDAWRGKPHWADYIPFQHPTAIGVICLLAVFGVAASRLILCQSRGHEVYCEAVEPKTADMIGFAIPYIVSFMGVKLGDPSSWVPFTFILLLMFEMTRRTQALFLNPVLVIMGYHLYHVTYRIRNGTAQSMVLFKGELGKGDKVVLEILTPFLKIAAKPQSNVESSRSQRGALADSQADRMESHDDSFDRSRVQEI